MKYEWKKGDKLKVVKASNELPLGSIWVASRDISTNNDNGDTYLVKNKDRPNWGSWNCERFVKVDANTKISQPKITPIELHITLVDACNNLVKVDKNYKDAEATAKDRSEAVTIYKLVPVAKVSSERKLVKVYSKKK